MKPDDKAKSASRKLSEAINAAAQESEAVRDAIRQLREMGYEAKISFHLDLLPIQPDEAADDPIAERFTDEDRKALSRMLIRVR